MPTVLITGANRGIGLAFAQLYAAEGWEVIAADRAPLAAIDLVNLGPGLREIRYDATRDDSADALVTRLAGRPLDLLVLNAGIDLAPTLPPEATTVSHWEEIMLTNTWAPFYLATRLEPNLRLGQLRKIVAISSPAATPEFPLQPRHFAYNASKAALNQLLRNLSIDWRDWGAVVLMLSPVQVKTRMTGFQGAMSAVQAATAMKSVIDHSAAAESGQSWQQDAMPASW